jgi:hypothetical protein
MLRPRYYRERETGDYLSIWPRLWRYDPHGHRVYDGRAPMIENMIASVCTIGVEEDFLRSECVRVLAKKVPSRWLRTLRGGR